MATRETAKSYLLKSMVPFVLAKVIKKILFAWDS